MAFDENPTPSVDSRYLGEGFRLEPDFREGPTGQSPGAPAPAVQPPAAQAPAAQTSTTPAPVSAATTAPMPRRAATPDLTHVFDDPAHGEPGRDRMLVHGVWELLLAVTVAAVGYLLYDRQPATFQGDGLRQLLLAATVLGLLAVASAVSLRAGAPNLAVGAIAAAAALHFADNSGGALAGPLLVVLALCAVVGLAQGLLVTALHAPSWAVSIGVALVLLIWSDRQGAVALTAGYEPTGDAYLWFAGFAGMSVLAGLIGLVPTLRRAFGRFRPVVDPAQRRGVVAALIAVAATVVSTAVAGLAGVLGASVQRSAEPSDGLVVTALALGMALLGGTSAFGRRGGIFGTVFAAALVAVAMEYADAADRSWPVAAFAAGAIGVGLAVTRLVERYGRPSMGTVGDDDEDWVPRVHAPSTASWSTTAKPATSTTSLNLWASEEAWGSSEGR